MQALKQLGCKFSLDDFGSGLSSFTYLKNLPVDYLKIDGQFIRNVAEDTVDESMVKAISEVGHALGIETIAERVETRQVLDKLGALGVEFAQGYYIARPTSVQGFAPWNSGAEMRACSETTRHISGNHSYDDDKACSQSTGVVENPCIRRAAIGYTRNHA